MNFTPKSEVNDNVQSSGAYCKNPEVMKHMESLWVYFAMMTEASVILVARVMILTSIKSLNFLL